jgi:hypothetical protein
LSDWRQPVEVRDQIGNFAIAELGIDIGRHDAPRFANGLRKLGNRQLATGEIRAESAFAFGTMTIPASRDRSVPQGLPCGGIPGLSGHVLQTDYDENHPYQQRPH